MNLRFKKIWNLTFAVFMGLLVSTGLNACKGKSNSEEKAFDMSTFNPETDSIPDELLVMLIDMNMEFSEFQNDAQSRMIEAIESNGLSAEEFEEMWKKENDPLMEESSLEGDQKALYDKINLQFDEISGDIEKMYKSKLAEIGISEESFRKIDVRIQSDKGLQERLNQIMMEKRNSMFQEPGMDGMNFDELPTE